MSIVADKDLRGNFGPPRDQDPRPTCMAFAASDAHAGVRAGWRPLSVEWLYYHALKRDGGVPHNGATMEGMLAALRLDGQPEEEAWPYIAELFGDPTPWVPPKANPGSAETALLWPPPSSRSSRESTQTSPCSSR